ncbi:hypothetical protein EDB86DRAFT_2960491 [Lactarius hatsudake]|nr:hypothetical protein EDB86DRAFT_2960491 [Lactarius hatsudake]
MSPQQSCRRKRFGLKSHRSVCEPWLPHSLVGPQIWMWGHRALSPDSISAWMTKQHCAQPSHTIGSATPLHHWQRFGQFLFCSFFFFTNLFLSYAGMRILALLISANGHLVLVYDHTPHLLTYCWLDTCQRVCSTCQHPQPMPPTFILRHT